ncbi:hypothetical protein Y032_0150g2734 [Ancylostoma ceylanicum]|uniref:Uncharacterized protein n=1 Tax=Ancylostoma ceylanicum TaxID=53326 RepID=A0A016T081_9BILA|nr:hypothetical protein Y032_0150g2734 [Ancylostoma ceylanicum]
MVLSLLVLAAIISSTESEEASSTSTELHLVSGGPDTFDYLDLGEQVSVEKLNGKNSVLKLPETEIS